MIDGHLQMYCAAFVKGLSFSQNQQQRCRLYRNRDFLCDNHVRGTTRHGWTAASRKLIMTGNERSKEDHRDEGGNRSGDGWWKKMVGTIAIAGVMLMSPGTAEALWRRGKGGSSVMKREEETEFVLPSQRAWMQRKLQRGGKDNALEKWGKPLGIIGLAGLGIGGLVQTGKIIRRRWERRRLKEFRQSMGQLGLEGLVTGLDEKSKTEKTRQDAKTFLAKDQGKYKFRAEEKDDLEQMASKVRLDLFKTGRKESTGAERVLKKSENVEAPVSENPQTDFEKAMLEAVRSAESGGSVKDALSEWLETDAVKPLTNAERRALFNSYASRLVSASIDKAGALIDSDASESLKVLTFLVKRMRSVKALSQADGGSGEGLNYVGAYVDSVTVLEELYRRYAVFCLSTEERVKENFQSLVEMQQLLTVSNERAEAINTEIAKGMFQIAVSAAMADGSMDEQSRATLDKLKDSFGDFLDGDSADSIMSEVSVMRAMYALQALLKEQGVSEEDISQLRKMCSELGVDIDEMMQNADALGAALGPEAKQFVESLRTLLSNPNDTTVAGEVMKDATPPATSAQPTASLTSDTSSGADPSPSNKPK